MEDIPRIRQGYRFALAPTADQQVFLRACVGASRFWFNQGLALTKERIARRASGEAVSVPWSYEALCTELPAKARADLAPWQHEVVCGCYQAGFRALGRALQDFSNRRSEGQRASFPQFRRKGGRQSEAVIFQRPRIVGHRHVEFDRRIGPVRSKERLTKLVHLLDSDDCARVLSSTVSRRNGKWFVSFTVERARKKRQARRPNAVAGVDLGLRHLATVSTGECVANGRPLEAALRRLRSLQRQLDRQRRAVNPGKYSIDGKPKPGVSAWRSSRRMERTQERIRRTHERVANLRREQAHQFTTALTREFGVLGVERLAVKNMLHDRHVAGRIADVGWAMILRQLTYKTAWSISSTLLAADRFYPSSKTCHACGTVKAKLGRGETMFACEVCEFEGDRDLNAALNLAALAYRHAQAAGLQNCYVARAGRVATRRKLPRHARGGQVSPSRPSGHSPTKREDSLESSRVREGAAVAIG